MSLPSIGIVGTGRMGAAFARRLVETGFPVAVWNRSPARAEDAVAAGARLAPDLAGLADGAEVVITSLTDAAALRAVLPGLAPGLRGKLVIEMSTLLPSEQQALADEAAAAGADYVDCPVGGTVAPALRGQLLGFAGGSDAAFARARPVIDALCRRVEHLGPVGAGARMKLAINLPLALYWAVLGESLGLLGGAVAPATAVALFADSSAGPTVLRNRADLVASVLADGDRAGTFDIDGLAKDLRLALRLGEIEGRDMPVARAALGVYEAAIARGLGGFDGASVARMLSGAGV